MIAPQKTAINALELRKHALVRHPKHTDDVKRDNEADDVGECVMNRCHQQLRGDTNGKRWQPEIERQERHCNCEHAVAKAQRSP